MKMEIEEAKRYLADAKEILSDKAIEEDGYYQDKKYVKLAGHAAYSAVLVALDVYLERKANGGQDAGLDKKLLNTFVSAYDTLHLSLSCDGNPNARVAKAGLEDAEYIVNWIEGELVRSNLSF